MATAVQTARDKAQAAKKQYETAKKAYSTKDTLPQQTKELKEEITALNLIISAKKEERAALVALKAKQSDIDVVDAEISGYQNELDILSAQLENTNLRIMVIASQAEQSAAGRVYTAASQVTTNASGAYATASSTAFGGLNYNASAVKEAYFSTRSSFIERVQAPNNQPRAVSSASQLWTASSGSKGMIVTSEQVLKAWNSGSNAPQSADYFDHHNYGFQFQYNPGSVSMSYFTSPNVDVTMMTSGQEMFNLAGISGAQGAVSFQIIINRIFDMQYFKTDGSLKTGLKSADLYPVPPTDTNDLKQLHAKGTMYDVEYLLRVLMGTTMNSYLRGEKTADMGWLPAIPVELHLGSKLRYLGTIGSVNLNHIIFDSRMVPLFTTMDISFQRLPDYPPSGTSPGNV